MYFCEGKESNVFDTTFGKIGVQICYDILFPETSMDLAHNSADLIINLSASPTTSRPLFHRMLPARAIETTCFYAYSNNIGTQGSLTFAGESLVVDPRGKTSIRGRDARIASGAKVTVKCTGHARKQTATWY